MSLQSLIQYSYHVYMYIYIAKLLCVVSMTIDCQHSHCVLDESGTVYNAVLGMVDITKGTNSYYKLQVLKSNYGAQYQLFRSWGRVGTTIGGNKLEVCWYMYMYFKL